MIHEDTETDFEFRIALTHTLHWPRYLLPEMLITAQIRTSLVISLSAAGDTQPADELQERAIIRATLLQIDHPEAFDEWGLA